jgi:PhnB protein
MMPTILNPYIGFKGNAREAMEFYKSVFGGELNISTFGEAQASQNPADANLIMHSKLETPGGLTLMGSDTPDGMAYDEGSRISISLSGDNANELRGYWNKLSEGSTPIVPLETAPWGDTFGMLTDKFGITWLVNISGSHA